MADGLDLKARVAHNSGLQVTLDFSGATAFPARTDVSSFSSRGPSVGSALKPDLAAVGEEIVTGAQSVNSSGESYSASGFIDTAGTSFSAPLAAGAAAVLKGARPGLSGQQYRSLLVNGALAATVSDRRRGHGVAGRRGSSQSAGGGDRDGGGVSHVAELRYARRDAAQYRAALAFECGHGARYVYVAGGGGGQCARSRRSRPNSVVLDVGASQQVAVTLDASGLAPGEYSGYLMVSGTATSTVARIPYWFAVPGCVPAGISVLYQDYLRPGRDRARRRPWSCASWTRLGCRTPVPLRPSVRLSGSGTVRSFYRTGTIPGTWAVDIRTGTADMQLSFTIGTVTQTVVIPVF